MSNITDKEWTELLLEIEKGVNLRWPQLRTKADKSSLHIEEAASWSTSGTVDLGMPPRNGDKFLVSSVKIGSSGGLPLNILAARAKLMEIQAVVDALTYAYAECENVCIYKIGKCPCSHCGGRGGHSTGGKDCENCKGAGVV
jgi:hypothetical protein